MMGSLLPDREGLPSELDELGERLQIAASAQLARRRARRRAVRKGAFSVLVGTPLALAIAASELAPSSAPVERIAGSSEVGVTTTDTMTTTRLVDRQPDAARAARGWPCVMYPDCRPATESPTEPSSVGAEPPRPPMVPIG